MLIVSLIYSEFIHWVQFYCIGLALLLFEFLFFIWWIFSFMMIMNDIDHVSD